MIVHSKKILNQQLFKKHPIKMVPFSWGKIQNFLPKERAKQLIRDFPSSHFMEVDTLNKEKNYRMWVRHVKNQYRPEILAANSLAPVWHKFISEVTSEAYTNSMSEYVGFDLSSLSLEMNFWKYDASCWLSPHCDKPEKAVTQLFYLNESWEESWGGNLKILNSNQMEDVNQKVLPTWENSVVLVRSDKSWHAVEKLVPNINRQRLSFQLIWKYDVV